MRRLPGLLALLLALAVAAPAARAADLSGDPARWDVGKQATVVRAGLLAPRLDGFHGERRLTARQLRAATAALAARLGATPVVTPTGDRAVTVAALDRVLVAQLGLADVAAAVQAQARRAGLRPPARFGAEVVARTLGLRVNHPAPAGDRLELFPWDRVTRAEAAYSLARIAGFGGWEVAHARAELARFVLPRYAPAQLQALRVAVSRIGMPYVWGGETDGPSPGQLHGGFDCSGFAWRVFKLSGLAAGRAIGGRTAAQQAGEIPRAQRVALQDVRPGDLLFFGPAGFAGKATEQGIVHEGIALSGDFAIHSSSQGVYVSPLLEGWLHDGFAWARRVL